MAAVVIASHAFVKISAATTSSPVGVWPALRVPVAFGQLLKRTNSRSTGSALSSDQATEQRAAPATAAITLKEEVTI